MNGSCKPWPLFFALAVGSQISPRLRKAVLLQEHNGIPAVPQDLAEAYEEATLPGQVAQVDDRRLPKSPTHAGDISPTDQWEKVDHAATVSADEATKIPQIRQLHDSTFPLTVSGPTCEVACLTCMQVNVNFPNCECRATCQTGGGGSDVCEGKDLSWSNEDVTSPTEVWQGQCQAGKVSCKDCLSEELVAENKRCGSDAACRMRLQRRLSKPADAKQSRYCSNSDTERFPSCKTFTYDPKDNGWTCYTTLEQCKSSTAPRDSYEDGPEFGPPNGELLTPCVWCGVDGRKDPSKPAALQVGVEDVSVNVNVNVR